jgi:hypothetical protein
MTFYETYVLLINVLARLFGALAFVAGSFSLLSAYAFEMDVSAQGSTYFPS